MKNLNTTINKAIGLVRIFGAAALVSTLFVKNTSPIVKD